MRRKVKGGIEKHYCDKCKKLLYDAYFVPSGIFVFGQEITEQKTKKRYADFKSVHRSFKGVRYEELCVSCFDDLGIKY